VSREIKRWTGEAYRHKDFEPCMTIQSSKIPRAEFRGVAGGEESGERSSGSETTSGMYSHHL